MTEKQAGHGEPPLHPQTILDMNYAFARTALLVASVRLHIFTLLSAQALTPAELAARADIQPEGTARLLKGLAALELVEEVEAEGAYRLTPLAQQFLVEGKPSYLGGDTLAMLDFMPAWFNLAETLQTSVPYRDLGDPATAEEFFAPRVVDMFTALFPTARRVAATLSLRVPEDRPLRVLDVAAGSAPWSAAFARQYPSAEVTALDLPAVAAQGRQHMEAQGLAARYTWLAADMESFTFAAEAFDLVLCAHVSRFLSDERTRTLLGRLAHTLRPGGTLLVADIFQAEDRHSPPAALTIDLSMLVNTAQGRIRTAGEIAAWLRALDLADVECLQIAGPFPVVVARKDERL